MKAKSKAQASDAKQTTQKSNAKPEKKEDVFSCPFDSPTEERLQREARQAIVDHLEKVEWACHMVVEIITLEFEDLKT